MSVVSNERSMSRMQFIKVAQDLLKFTTKQCLKLPKRLTFVITTDIIKTAQEIYKTALYIRSIFSKETASMKRIDLCEFTIARLDYLASMLDLLQVYAPIQEPDKYKKNKPLYMSSKTFEQWVRLIEEETLLIKGLIKKEKEKPKPES